MKQRQATKGSKGAFRIVEFKNPSGVTVFRVTGSSASGARIRENYRNHLEAVSRMAELEIQAANIETTARPVITRLSPEQVAVAETGFTQLGDRSMLAAISYYLTNYREPVRSISISEAFAQFIHERKLANLRPLSIRNLEIKCRELVTNYGRNRVAEISTQTIRDLIFKPSRGPKARDNHRRALNAFFEWAIKGQYCESNPVAAIGPIKTDRHDPAILTPAEAESLLRAAQAHKGGMLVPYVALALFAGLRPTELSRMTWDRIDLDNRTITVGADIAKMRGRRVVEIEKNLVEWLRPFATTRPPIKPANWRKEFDSVKVSVGWGTPSKGEPDLRPWVQDILRHSAITYHLLLHEHEGRTAQWGGNSPDIIQRHYKALAVPVAAKRFWAIVPKMPKGKILEVPKRSTLAATA